MEDHTETINSRDDWNTKEKFNHPKKKKNWETRKTVRKSRWTKWKLSTKMIDKYKYRINYKVNTLNTTLDCESLRLDKKQYPTTCEFNNLAEYNTDIQKSIMFL